MVRQIVTAARTPKIATILKRRAGKRAIIDQTTSWDSTYLMIQRLLDPNPFLVDMANPDVTLSERQWTQVTELGLLRRPYTTTKRLQTEDLTPVGGLTADGIVASMKKREALLLENKILLAAIYVDPVHRILLNDEQLTKGKAALWMNGLHE
ncbi:hypothetical protein Cfor_03940, partial [Coptotermes formosanus]